MKGDYEKFEIPPHAGDRDEDSVLTVSVQSGDRCTLC